jgi:SAM-dependent methyltransferase
MDSAGWDEKYRSAERLWSVTPNIFVADRLRYATPGRGLDLAGGEGRNAIWLSSLGWQMTVVDFSQVAVARGAEQSDDVEFIVADVLEWEPEGTFDLILIVYLHLLPADFEKVVLRATDWLSPGGEVFLIGHDVTNTTDGWGGPQYPEILWNLADLLGWLDGLTVVESEVVRRPVDTDEGRRYARDALVRARAFAPTGSS